MQAHVPALEDALEMERLAKRSPEGTPAEEADASEAAERGAPESPGPHSPFSVVRFGVRVQGKTIILDLGEAGAIGITRAVAKKLGRDLRKAAQVAG